MYICFYMCILVWYVYCSMVSGNLMSWWHGTIMVVWWLLAKVGIREYLWSIPEPSTLWAWPSDVWRCELLPVTRLGQLSLVGLAKEEGDACLYALGVNIKEHYAGVFLKDKSGPEAPISMHVIVKTYRLISIRYRSIIVWKSQVEYTSWYTSQTVFIAGPVNFYLDSQVVYHDASCISRCQILEPYMDQVEIAGEGVRCANPSFSLQRLKDKKWPVRPVCVVHRGAIEMCQASERTAWRDSGVARLCLLVEWLPYAYNVSFCRHIPSVFCSPCGSVVEFLMILFVVFILSVRSDFCAPCLPIALRCDVSYAIAEVSPTRWLTRRRLICIVDETSSSDGYANRSGIFVHGSVLLHFDCTAALSLDMNLKYPHHADICLGDVMSVTLSNYDYDLAALF